MISLEIDFRFIAGKVRPLGMEGLGTKVKEVFNESKVMEHMWSEANFP